MDALALGSEEGRDKLRKAAGIGTYDAIRRYPNGATRRRGAPALSKGKSERGELKHLSTHRKRKQQ